jgi:hypothetical protein
MKTCAVIMAAHKAVPFIEQAVGSFWNQLPEAGWRYELRLGVDGCHDTREYLRGAGIPHHYSLVNVGPYVMRNSLIALGEADAYAIFDADDVMLPYYLRTLLPREKDGIVGGGRRQIREDGSLIPGPPLGFGYGVSVITGETMRKLGGFLSVKVAGDSEFLRRAGRAGIKVRRYAGCVYYRRIHGNSLTQSEETGRYSNFREKVKAYLRSDEVAKMPTCIEPQTVKLLEWP